MSIIFDALEIVKRLSVVESKVNALEKQMSSQQSAIDALTAQVTAMVPVIAAITTDLANIEAELVAAQKANPSADLSGLTTAISSLSGNVNQLKATADADAAPPATPGS